MHNRTERHAVTPARRQIGHLHTWIISSNLFAPIEQIFARRSVAHISSFWLDNERTSGGVLVTIGVVVRFQVEWRQFGTTAVASLLDNFRRRRCRFLGDFVGFSVDLRLSIFGPIRFRWISWSLFVGLDWFYEGFLGYRSIFWSALCFILMIIEKCVTRCFPRLSGGGWFWIVVQINLFNVINVGFVSI